MPLSFFIIIMISFKLCAWAKDNGKKDADFIKRFGEEYFKVPVEKDDNNDLYINACELINLFQTIVFETMNDIFAEITDERLEGFQIEQSPTKQPEKVTLYTSVAEQNNKTGHEKIVQLISTILMQKSLKETVNFVKQISPETKKVIKEIINTPDKHWSNTFLHKASTALEVEQLLLLGADPEIKNELGRTPLMALLFDGKCEAAKMLISKLPSFDFSMVDNEGANLTLCAVRSGDTKIVDLFLKKGGSLNSEVGGVTPLLIAVGARNIPMVRYLLKLGVDVNQAITATDFSDSNRENLPDTSDIIGVTPLMMAASNDDGEMVRLLLKAGANVNAMCLDGSTALIKSLAGSNVFKILIDAGANVNVTTHNGFTALLAATIIQPNAIMPLLKAGALANSEISKDYFIPDMPSVNLQGLTPLLMAIKNAPDTVLFLIDAGANINHRTDEGLTPLMMAVISNNIDLISQLLEKGAQVNCAMICDSPYLKVLLQDCLSSKFDADTTGLTPLMIATILDEAPTVTILLKHGADRNVKNAKGLTALNMAIMKNIAEILSV